MNRSLISILAAVIIVSNACGGAPPSAQSPDPSGSPPTASQVAADSTEPGAATTPAGDGGSTTLPPGGGSAGFDPCTLNTPEEVEAIYGAEVAETETHEEGCFYRDADGFTVLGTTYAPTGRAVFEGLRDAYPEDLEDLAGIGDGAVWAWETTLVILKGETTLSIHGSVDLPDQPPDKATNRAAAEEIARLAIGRIP